MNRRPGTPESDHHARGSKPVWIIASALLILVIVLGIFAFGYGASDPPPGEAAVDAPDA
jgi:hypothetical protein